MRIWVILCALALAAFASAAKFQTKRFDVDISIARYGDVTFTETIGVVFTEKQRGLILKKPRRTRSDDGKIREVQYELLEATIQQAGNPKKVQSRATPQGGDWEVRLGSPDVWISGAATYKVRYRVRGAMTPINKDDKLGPRTEFLWNLLPTDWPTQIPASTITLVYPQPQAGTVLTRVLAGPKGTRQGIQITYGGQKVGRSNLIDVEFLAKTTLRVRLKNPLPSGQTVTAALALPGDTIEAHDPMIYTENAGSSYTPSSPYSPANVTSQIGQLNPGFAIFPALPGILVFLLARRRWARPEKPLVVKFDPPPGVGPSLAGTVIDQSVNRHDIVAGIVSLAQKGALRLHHPENSAEGVTIEMLGLYRARGVDQIEQYLYGALAQYGTLVTPDMLRGSFGDSYRTAQTMLMNEARTNGWLVDSGTSKGCLGCSLWVFTAIAAFGLCMFQPLSLVGGFFGIVLGMVGVAKITSLTPPGQDVRRELQGLKEFIVRAQERELNYMAQVDPGQALFERLLPYAVAFDAVKQWTRAFEGIDIQMPTWYDAPYTGTDMFWTAMLLNDLTSVQQDYGSAMAYTEPTSSFDSGSSFSSGDSAFGSDSSWSDSSSSFDSGFSSGDGGGGGGGDSW